MKYFEDVTNFHRNQFQLQPSQPGKKNAQASEPQWSQGSSTSNGAAARQGGAEADVRLPLQKWDVGSSVGAADLQLRVFVFSLAFAARINMILWEVENHYIASSRALENQHNQHILYSSWS